MIKRLLFFLISFFLVSCSSYGPEELDRLMKEDPSFRQMIVTRDKVHSEISLIKQDLLLRKKTVDAQVNKLRNDYDVYAKAQNVKVEKYQQAIEANKNVLKHEIEIASAQLESKEKEMEGYEKTLTDVKKVLRESKGINLSAGERQKWEERVLLLSEKIRPLHDEIEDLKIQNRLKKRKISFLK